MCLAVGTRYEESAGVHGGTTHHLSHPPNTKLNKRKEDDLCVFLRLIQSGYKLQTLYPAELALFERIY